MKVICLKVYKNRNVVYNPGEVFNITEEEFDFLNRDAPGCFKKARGRPPKNKMVESPVVKK